jgi:hypothetical protein
MEDPPVVDQFWDSDKYDVSRKKADRTKTMGLFIGGK